MGLTREQWQQKRINEIIDYVKKNGKKMSSIIYWDTYPVCVKDICVLGIAVLEGNTLGFGDWNAETKSFNLRRKGVDVERTYLEAVLADMKETDKKYKK